jgi:hypothetical protein
MINAIKYAQLHLIICCGNDDKYVVQRATRCTLAYNTCSIYVAEAALSLIEKPIKRKK